MVGYARTYDKDVNPVQRREFLLASSAATLASCAADIALRLPVAQKQFPILPVGGGLTLRARITEPAFGRVGYEVNGIGVNPTLVFARGSTLSVALQNDLPQPTTIHWHGLSAPSRYDGAGFDSVLPGKSFRYRFQIEDRAGTYWYHPHPHHFTGEQVYHGMAGLVIVRDAEDFALEKSLGTKLGETDLPIVLQDAYYRQNIWQPYAPDNADCIDGFFGNAMHANGARNAQFFVSPGWVRLRLVNASTARGLLISFTQGEREVPFTILGNDGGLLPTAQIEQRAFLYPAERLDIALDCSALKPGESIAAQSLEFTNRHQHEEAKPKVNVHHEYKNANSYPRLSAYAWCDSRGGVAIASDAPQERAEMADDGAALPMFTLIVTKPEIRKGAIPTAQNRPFLSQISQKNVPDRTFRLDLDGTRGWTMGGKKFDDPDAAIRVQRGAKEVWEIHNAPISMPHPIHLHGFHFRVLSRTALFGPAKTLARHEGNLLSSDLGLKDTVTVWPNERVRIAVDFSHSHEGPQRYMFHCHNLEHEDAMMMLPVEVL
jgi:blue copper oxidase